MIARRVLPLPCSGFGRMVIPWTTPQPLRLPHLDPDLVVLDGGVRVPGRHVQTWNLRRERDWGWQL
jgi:hypothetical protein